MNEQSFINRLNKLNPEQREAVEQTEGPVLVVAGPGTGKTETLGARIANILRKQTDIHSGNILCLTYTNAGVVAMRKRLLEFIGPDAHNIEIHTFHSFCNQIIQENSDQFPISGSENISELEQMEVIESLLENLPSTDPHFQKNSFSNAKDLIQFLGTCKSEKWTKEIILTSIAEFKESLPTREEFQYKRKYTNKRTGEIFQKGDINPQKIGAIQEKLKKLESAAHLLEKYQTKLREQGKYDFNDMILWILEAFETNKNFLAQYQEQFQYILVDEFQDTNGSQKLLLDFLCEYWESPNVFVVGDDDQSIYRFQGANMRNIMEYYDKYKSSVKVITLDKNYRSSSEILSLSPKIISKNTERLENEIKGLNKTLTANHPRFDNTDSPTPSLRKYYNSYHEDLGIYKRVVALQKRGVDLSEIAIVYQNHAQAQMLIKLFESKKIPIRVKETQNVLSLPVIQSIITFLTYFQKESEIPFSGDSFLFSSFFAPFVQIPQREIIEISIARKEEMKKEQTSNMPLKEIIGRDDIGEIWNKYSEKIYSLEELFHMQSPIHFLESLFSILGVTSWITSTEEQGFLLRALSTFFHFVQSQQQKNPNISIKELLEILERMNRHTISLPIEKIQYEKNGVHFITAHSSKGLEFEYVFLKGVEKKIWDSSQRKKYFVPDTLTISNEGKEIEEKRRLFFVALTRAKNFIEVSCSQKDMNGNESDSSVFISEMEEYISPELVEYPEDEIMALSEIELLPIEKEYENIDTSFIAGILENYTLSPTHLNKYLECPKAFFYENLLQIPSSMPPGAIFGSAIHAALEKGYREVSHTTVFSEESIIQEFTHTLEKYGHLLSPSETKKYLSHGKKVLHEYFSHFLEGNKIEHPIKIEKSICSGIGDIPIKGKLDRIDFLPNGEIRVVDYKTGNAESSFTKEKLLPPSEKNNHLGGDYWRQMVFYSLLIDQSSQFTGIFSEGVFDFIEPVKGSFIQKKLSISSEEKQMVEDQIKSVYAGIQAGNFEGCMKETCEWCMK